VEVCGLSDYAETLRRLTERAEKAEESVFELSAKIAELSQLLSDSEEELANARIELHYRED
jgi:prefoldin subunit 5